VTNLARSSYAVQSPSIKGIYSIFHIENFKKLLKKWHKLHTITVALPLPEAPGRNTDFQKYSITAYSFIV
jgi:hypothetical protein